MNCFCCGPTNRRPSEKDPRCCRRCSKLTQRQQYKIIWDRLNASSTRTRRLLSDAVKKGDEQTAWVCRQTLKELSSIRATLGKPM